MQHTTSLVSLAVLGSASLLKSADGGIEPVKIDRAEFYNVRRGRFTDTGTEILYDSDWDRAWLNSLEGNVNEVCADVADEWTKFCHNDG